MSDRALLGWGFLTDAHRGQQGLLHYEVPLPEGPRVRPLDICGTCIDPAATTQASCKRARFPEGCKAFWCKSCKSGRVILVDPQSWQMLENMCAFYVAPVREASPPSI